MLDSPTLSSTLESGHRGGYDGAKRKKGSKVHAAVDTLGHLLALRVMPATEQDRAQVEALTGSVQEEATGENVELAYVDRGYNGEKVSREAEAHGIRLEVVKHPGAKKGFVLLPRRWVVERSFAWATRFRRLAKDYERLPQTVAGLHFVAFACLFLQRTINLLGRVHNSLYTILQRYWTVRHHVGMDASSEDSERRSSRPSRGGCPRQRQLASSTWDILGQALRRYGQGGPVSRPEEASRLQTEDGRDRQEAPGGRPRGAPGGRAALTARVPRAGGWRAGERLYGFADAQAAWVELKKRRVEATERDEFLRAARRLLVAGDVDAQRLVFVDECATNTSISPLYAWSRRGEWAYGEAPRNWGSNVTLLASMTREGMGPSIAVEGATTKAVFEAYVEEALATSLRPGQLMVMDNLSSHKGQRVRELIEGRGWSCCTCCPTRPTSTPSSGPSREAQGSPRRAEARSFEALIEAMGRALGEITDRDASGLFRHCGYHAPAQLL